MKSLIEIRNNLQEQINELDKHISPEPVEPPEPDDDTMHPMGTAPVIVDYIANDRGTERVIQSADLPPAKSYVLTYRMKLNSPFTFNVKGDGNQTYTDTGYPYQTGKLHGLAPKNPTTGRGEETDDGWSVRVIWRRDVHTHNLKGGSDTDKLPHEKGVALGLTVYDQRDDDHAPGFSRVSDFTDIQNDVWYDIEMGVQVNHLAQKNGIAYLKIYEGDDLVGSLLLENLELRKVNGLIERFLFHTWFGGSSEAFSPQINQQSAVFSDIQVLPGEYFEPPSSEPIIEPDPKEPVPDPRPQSKLTTIHTESLDPLSGINAVVYDNGSTKVYVGQRNGNNLLEFESTDFENWKNNGNSGFRHGMNFFRGSNGRLHGYRADGSDMNLYLGSQLQNSIGTAYTWRIDGAVNMHQTPDGRFRAFGRVRGNRRSKRFGGWGGDVPRYPEAPFNDRRGISYHSSDTWQANWEKNRILADPADYFAGYHDRDIDLVPDFYESIFFPSGYGFVTVFWKRRSRKWVSEDGEKQRLTGEIYPVPAIYSGGKIALFPDKTVIPRHYHEHDGIPRVDGKLSIGEIYIGGLMQRGKTIYIFYKHRGGIHYESHGKHPSGIYVYQMNIGQFNNLYT